MPGAAVYLAGEFHPADLHVEDALRSRLSATFPEFISQQQLLAHAGEAGFQRGIPARLAMLEEVGASRPGLILIGRSSGARVATLFACRRPVAAVICLGYPFREAGRVLEPARFAHLAAIATPTLIIQGVRDVYGGLNVTEDYALSGSIRLHFFQGTHDFRLGPGAWDRIAHLIQDFAARGGEQPGNDDMQFDEAFYMRQYPGVASAVAAGQFASGADHFRKHGRQEGRSFRVLPDDGILV